jgi:L,D-transpeptidase ErfK/SrfK
MRKGIVINMPELRLYYFTPDKQSVYTYPVGLGRDQWRTPLFQSKVVSKEVDPTWRPPASIRHHVLEETGNLLPTEVLPGPENPLGPYALRLSANGYLIHGTNQPFSIGKYISSGCIRLHNEDVEELFNIVPVGTPVSIINYPYKAGWQEGKLYLQAQIPMQLDAGSGQLNPGSVRAVIAQSIKSRPAQVDWRQVDEVMEKHTGIPQLIGNYGILSASLGMEEY